MSLSFEENYFQNGITFNDIWFQVSFFIDFFLGFLCTNPTLIQSEDAENSYQLQQKGYSFILITSLSHIFSKF